MKNWGESEYKGPLSVWERRRGRWRPGCETESGRLAGPHQVEPHRRYQCCGKPPEGSIIFIFLKKMVLMAGRVGADGW